MEEKKNSHEFVTKVAFLQIQLKEKQNRIKEKRKSEGKKRKNKKRERDRKGWEGRNMGYLEAPPFLALVSNDAM